jgi:holo-[acyl-carrier protein] synthase
VIGGLGTDIIEIQRIRAGIERHKEHFLNKLFTPEEQNYCLSYRDPGPSFAGRFAAKEAIIKALGKGFRKEFTWLDIEILNNAEGKPIVYLSAEMNKIFNKPQFLLSISHCREYAMATAIWLQQ